MSIYILVGLFIAGILKQIIPDNFISKHLGKGSFSSVIKATVLGIPLPVCSCSVIPLAQSLRKEGASRGAVQSFLISSPITGVDSILATYSFFGLFFTVFRVISSSIIAIVTGVAQNLVQKDEVKVVNNVFFKEGVTKDNIVFTKFSNTKFKEEKKKFCIKEVFSYAYGTLFKEMVKPLVIGLIFATLFTSFAPKEYTSLLFENQFLTYLVIVLFSTPLYICATASLPIAAALISEGMSPGAGFIFLSAGPATSFITMSVVYKTLGKVSLIVYLSSILSLSLIFGIVFDTFFQEVNIINFNLHNEETSIFAQISSDIMLMMMVYYLVKPYISKQKDTCCSSEKCHKH
ncbi:MAG: hypothetical protein CSA86_05735 [Arcobacter sp.]|nr:MAG: hypothetical protein CSA86_05735 [Arcobacter sp.]